MKATYIVSCQTAKLDAYGAGLIAVGEPHLYPHATRDEAFMQIGAMIATLQPFAPVILRVYREGSSRSLFSRTLMGIQR